MSSGSARAVPPRVPGFRHVSADFGQLLGTQAHIFSDWCAFAVGHCGCRRLGASSGSERLGNKFPHWSILG